MGNIQTVINKLVPGLRKIFGDSLTSIILYGSVVCGTQTEESDVDVAVIVKSYSEEMHQQMIDLTVDLDLDYGCVLSVLLIEEEQFEEWGDVLPFYVNIKKEGQVLWNAA